MPAPRNLHSGASQVLSAVMVLLGVAILVSHARARRRPARARRPPRGPLRRGRRRPPLRRTCARAVGAPALRRSLGWWTLFAIVYAAVASAIYFSLGVIADHALGLTPVVFLLAGVFFLLAAMTYVEGASLHQDRGGVDGLRPLRLQRARELRRRLGGAAGLHHPASPSARSRRRTTSRPSGSRSGDGMRERLAGLRDRRLRRRRNDPRVLAAPRRRAWRMVVVADLGVQLLVVVVGLAMFFHPGADPRPDPARPPAAVGGLLLRAGHRHRRLHRPGVGLGAGGRGARDAPRPQAPGQLGHDRRRRPLRRHRASSR